MSTKQILQEAYNLIENPEHWTQVVLARDTDGNSVEPCDPTAVCFCAIGALYRVCNAAREDGDAMLALGETREDVLEAGKTLAESMGWKNNVEAPMSEVIYTVNDDYDGHARILQAFRKAIDNV